MKEITVDKEKAEKIKLYLHNNNFNCALKTFLTYIDYTEKVFSVLGTNQKKNKF